MTKAAIVILNYNGLKYLQEFLPTVVKYNRDDCRIIIADNASTDASVAYLQENHPSLEIIRLNKNYGFSHGYNEALKKVEAEYYILLNSDVEVTAGWLDPLIELLDHNPDVAACQPKILSYHRRTHFEYAGAAGGYIDFLGYPFCRGRIFETVEEDLGQYDDIVPIFWATGACLMIRSKIFHEAGGFDESFFAHMEEIDLCWRLHLLGYKVYYSGHSQVYHVGGGTLPKTSPVKTYLNFRNGLSMLYKNTYDASKYYKLPLRILMDIIAAFKFLITNSYENSLAVLRGIVDSMKKYKINRQKKKHASRAKHLHIEEIYNKSIVMEYYLKKNRTYKELFF